MRDRVALHVGSSASLGDLLSDALVVHKSEVALIEADRKREVRRLTFLMFDQTARRVTRRLQDAGIGADARVAILLSNQPEWLLTAHAVFQRGGVLVPLDPKLDAKDQAALLAHARPALLVIEYPLWRRFEGEVAAGKVWVVEAPEGVDLRGAERFEALPDGEGDRVSRARGDLATIVYSSGTGGAPKGCLLTHGAYLSQLEGLLERFPMVPGDHYFSVLPTNHAIDFMVGFVGPFVCGATVVHQRTLRPEMIRFTMTRYGITHMAVVPLLLAAFVRAVREQLDALPGWQRQAVDAAIGLNARLTATGPNHGLSSRLLEPIHRAFGGRLRLVFCGGAFTDRDHAEFLSQVGIPVVIGYGLTEACTVVTVNGTRPMRADSVGDPVLGVELRIDEPDDQGVGEVCVRGPTVMVGYLDDPELSAETIREGWLHTGDLGWIDASRHLHLVGRSKDVIVTAGGKNVYPEDIEQAFRGIDAEEIVVFAANTIWPTRSLVDEELVIVVRPKAGTPWLEPLARCNRSLPEHKRVRSALSVEEPFPRTASMKVKRKALAAALGAIGKDSRVTL